VWESKKIEKLGADRETNIDGIEEVQGRRTATSEKRVKKERWLGWQKSIRKTPHV